VKDLNHKMDLANILILAKEKNCTCCKIREIIEIMKDKRDEF